MRRGRDSNPRYLAVNTLSKRARSATLTPLLILFYSIQTTIRCWVELAIPFRYPYFPRLRHQTIGHLSFKGAQINGFNSLNARNLLDLIKVLNIGSKLRLFSVTNGMISYSFWSYRHLPKENFSFFFIFLLRIHQNL